MVIVTYRFRGAKAGFPSIAGAGCQGLGLTTLARGVLLPGYAARGDVWYNPKARSSARGARIQQALYHYSIGLGTVCFGIPERTVGEYFSVGAALVV